ncbi:MAG: C4-type zinc ribbon domain-containing protein [Candidatus Goldbacteria bacterium]|nr:C4-type zinc ribbon domain-containing protein [Candidatus Goldiibacteriota bacterium]
MEDVKQILSELIELQKVDVIILNLESEKRELEAKIIENQKQIENNRLEFENKKKKLDDTRKKRNMLELEIKAKEQDIKKKEEQTSMIKTNEAYKVLQEEILAIKKDIQILEEKIIAIMEEEEEINKWLKEQEKIVKQEEERINNIISDYKKHILEKENLINQENIKREEMAKKVNKNWYERYEKIRKNKGGIALAPIEIQGKDNAICGGCKMTVRAQAVIDVKKCKEIIACENCARIWYIEDKV